MGTVMSINKTEINNKITKLAASERVTKAMLSELSRDLLAYIVVDGSMDIDSVNRCITVLTPMNKKTACFFFNEMLPFSFDEATCSFGGLQKKVLAKKTEAINTFLEDETNDLWSWAADNIKMEKKKVDYLSKITSDVTKALNDDDNEVSLSDVLAAVIASESVDLVSLMLAMESVGELKEAA